MPLLALGAGSWSLGAAEVRLLPDDESEDDDDSEDSASSESSSRCRLAALGPGGRPRGRPAPRGLWGAGARREYPHGAPHGVQYSGGREKNWPI